MPLSAEDLNLLTTVALRHAALLRQLRDALAADDNSQALQIARQICAMGEKEDSLSPCD